jgi:hypothetical protein
MGEGKKTGAGVQPLYEIIGYLDRRAPFPIGSMLLGLVSGVYLFNPTAGLLELIPDNLPVVGNLDEATAAFLLFWCSGNLVRWWRIRRAQRRALEEDKEES